MAKAQKYFPPLLALLLMIGTANLPNVWILYNQYEAGISAFMLLSLGFLMLLLNAVIVALLGKKSPLFFFLSLLLAPIEFASLYIANEPINYGLVQAGLNTNLNEVSELSSAFIFIGAIMAWLCFDYIFFWKKFRGESLKLSFRLRTSIILVFSLFFLAIMTQMYRLTDDSDSKEERLDFALTNTMSKIYKVFPFDVIHYSTKALYDNYQAGQLNEQIGKGTFHLESSGIDSLKQERNLIVFCIGETGNRRHWSLFGYERNTTPKLQARQNLIPFDNVLASATLTSMAVPMLLSRSCPTKPKLWQKEGTLVHLFNKANYQTAYLGNQASDFPIITVISKQADQYFNSGSEHNLNTYDEVLFEPFKQLLHSTRTKEQNTFVVLHTIGGHFRYDRRYPENFEQFKPTIKDLSTIEALSGEHREALINSYDNSLLYTDFVLDTFLKELDKLAKPAVFVYCPDHGEDLGENGGNNLLHGSENPTLAELEIPMFIAFNKAFQAKNSDTIEQLKKISNKAICTSDIPALLVTLSGVQVREFPHSILEDDYPFKTKQTFLSPNHKIKNIPK